MRDDFAEKLRLTSAALGCVSYKDLCARFHAANPSTHCTLPRLQKWAQGRAMPRSSQFYDDWAKVLGMAGAGAWLVRCSAAELRTALAERQDDVPALSPLSATMRARGVRADETGIPGGVRALSGSYACYSRAWSPHYRGCLIRGSMTLRPARGGTLQAIYRETIVTGPVRLSGEVMVTGRTLQIVTREPGGGLPLFFSLVTPNPPASVLCGVMAGAAFVANSAMPSATRILLVRVPDSATLDASNHYMVPERLAIAEDLRALGLRAPDAEHLDGLVATFLGPEPSQVRAGDQVAFAEALDPIYLRPAPSAAIVAPPSHVRLASVPR